MRQVAESGTIFNSLFPGVGLLPVGDRGAVSQLSLGTEGGHHLLHWLYELLFKLLRSPPRPWMPGLGLAGPSTAKRPPPTPRGGTPDLTGIWSAGACVHL